MGNMFWFIQSFKFTSTLTHPRPHFLQETVSLANEAGRNKSKCKTLMLSKPRNIWNLRWRTDYLLSTKPEMTHFHTPQETTVKDITHTDMQIHTNTQRRMQSEDLLCMLEKTNQSYVIIQMCVCVWACLSVCPRVYICPCVCFGDRLD